MQYGFACVFCWLPLPAQALDARLLRSPKENSVNEEILGGSFFALGRLPVEVFDEDNCPLCKKNILINTSVGHGKKFLEANNQN